LEFGIQQYYYYCSYGGCLLLVLFRNSTIGSLHIAYLSTCQIGQRCATLNDNGRSGLDLGASTKTTPTTETTTSSKSTDYYRRQRARTTTMKTTRTVQPIITKDVETNGVWEVVETLAVRYKVDTTTSSRRLVSPTKNQPSKNGAYFFWLGEGGRGPTTRRNKRTVRTL
jgi:hypothetical protein